jgi:hypothetical protein
MIKNLYTQVRDRIRDNVTALDTVGMFNNQFEKLETGEEESFALPSVFIQFLDFVYTNKGAGVQQFSGTVRLHFGFESYLAEDLTVWDITQTVNQQLHGWNPDSCGAMERIGMTMDSDFSNVSIQIVDYRVTGEDVSTYVKRQLVEATVTTVEIERDLVIDNATIRTGNLP